MASRNQSSRWNRHVYLYRHLRDALDRRKLGELYSTALTRACTGDPTETVEWQPAAESARDEELAERKNKLALVICPILAELDGPHPFQAICDVREGSKVVKEEPVLRDLPSESGRSSRGPPDDST